MLHMLLDASTAVSQATANINWEHVLEKLITWGVETGKALVAAILIYVIGRFIIKQINTLLAKILQKRKFEISVQTFLKSLVNLLLNLVLAFAIISKLGVETTSLAAILASAGVAIGMALSGNLSNFAGGLIVLVFKPFKVGDYIESSQANGTVKEIQISTPSLPRSTTALSTYLTVPSAGMPSPTTAARKHAALNGLSEWNTVKIMNG